MNQYLKDLQYILINGRERADRTETGTLQVFGMQSRYNLQNGFPMITTKKMNFNSILSEILWMMSGSGDERKLCEIRHGTHALDKKTIWTANANADYWKPKAKFPGDLGRVYGVNWRHWQTFHSLGHSENSDDLRIGKLTETDQLNQLINGIKNDPFGRRHLLTAWNPGELDQMALPPCHLLAQFNVGNLNDEEINICYFRHRANLPDLAARQEFDKLTNSEGQKKTIDDLIKVGLPTHKLDCQMYQRSADWPLGIPYNIASYSLLTHMIAQVCNLAVGEFIHVVGDAHVYKNQIETAKEQILRKPYSMPTLKMNPRVNHIDGFTMDDFELVNYKHHAKLDYPFSV